MSDNTDLTQEELTRVHNALDALSHHQHTPTTTEWNTIMEESTRKVARPGRTKLLSIAASVLVLLVAATVVIASQGTGDKIRSIDKGKNERQNTSSQLELIEGNYSLKMMENIPFQYQPALFDPRTGMVVKSFETDAIKTFLSVDTTDGFLVAEIGQGDSCDTKNPQYLVINLQTLDAQERNDVGTPSPDGKKFLNTSCEGEDPKTGTHPFAVTFEDGTDKVFSPTRPTKNTVKYITEGHWIDNTRILVMVSEGDPMPNDVDLSKVERTSYYAILNVGEDNSLDDIEKISGSDSLPLIDDVIADGDDIYVLYTDDDGAASSITVANVLTQQTVHTIEYEKLLPGYVGYASIDIQFGTNVSEIFGGFGYLADNKPATTMKSKAFAYDIDNNIFATAKGEVLVPKK